MSTVPERLTAIETTQQQHGEILERIDKSLTGNGRAGLITRVDRLEQCRKGGLVWFSRVWQIISAAALVWLAATMKG